MVSRLNGLLSLGAPALSHNPRDSRVPRTITQLIYLTLLLFTPCLLVKQDEVYRLCRGACAAHSFSWSGQAGDQEGFGLPEHCLLDKLVSLRPENRQQRGMILTAVHRSVYARQYPPQKLPAGQVNQVLYSFMNLRADGTV